MAKIGSSPKAKTHLHQIFSLTPKSTQKEAKKKKKLAKQESGGSKSAAVRVVA